MKKIALCLISVLLLFNIVTVSATSSKSYVGNKSTKVYHISECTYAGKISSENRVYFNSRSEAESRGYRRCHYCGDGVVEPGHNGGGGAIIRQEKETNDASLSSGFTFQWEELLAYPIFFGVIYLASRVVEKIKKRKCLISFKTIYLHTYR